MSKGGHSPANIAHHLGGMDFPAGKQDLINHAKGKNAGQDVMEIVKEMPDREFGSMADVMKGVRKVE